MRHNLIPLVLLCAFAASPLEGREPQRTRLSVTGEEIEGKRMLVARFTGPGPLAEQTVAFFAKRAFGLLPLGEEELTDEKGVATKEFPADLPGDSKGKVFIVAKLEATDKTPALTAETAVAWGVPISSKVESPPRTLWSSRAPTNLVLVVVLLLAGVWCTYAYAGYQIYRIKKGGDFHGRN